MKVSVIIPVYNAEQYLRKCLDSVIVQSYPDWEIIAINDGSRDNSWSILCQYEEREQRIIIATKENEGPGLTRNLALTKASGDVIVFLDADDYIEPDYFELLVNTMTKDNADVVFIDVIQERADGRILKYEKMSSFRKLSKKTIIGCQMTGYMPWGGCRKAASRSLINKYHLCFTNSLGGEEAIYSFELLRHARKVSFIEKYLYHYINHPNSQSKVAIKSTTLDDMKRHLDEVDLGDEYNDCLNAFAFTKLVLWILDESKRTSFTTCLVECRSKVKEFEEEFGWNVGKHYLRKEIRLLIPIIRMKMLLPVIVVARVLKR